MQFLAEDKVSKGTTSCYISRHKNTASLITKSLEIDCSLQGVSSKKGIPPALQLWGLYEASTCSLNQGLWLLEIFLNEWGRCRGFNAALYQIGPNTFVLGVKQCITVCCLASRDSRLFNLGYSSGLSLR